MNEIINYLTQSLFAKMGRPRFGKTAEGKKITFIFPSADTLKFPTSVVNPKLFFSDPDPAF